MIKNLIRSNRILKSIALVGILGMMLPHFLYAQLPQHANSYPLIGWQSFSGALEEFYARFDLIATRHYESDWAQRVKAINPNVALVFTYDWNTAQHPYIKNFPEEWYLYDSQHNIIEIYGGFKMVNFTLDCPKASAGEFAGLRFCDYLPIFLDNLVDMNYFDGQCTDGIWGRSEMYYMWDRDQFADTDLNNNGVNDHDEMSKTEFLDSWQGGITVIQSKLRELIGPNKLLIVNSGNQHTWGWEFQNGVTDEKGRGFYKDDKFDSGYYTKFKGTSLKPYTSFVLGLPTTNHPLRQTRSKNNFTEMRFGLITSIFNDNYFSFQDLDADEHYWSHWYDEFEMDLGSPTTSAYKIATGVWVRFFTKGCVIASTDGSTHSVAASELVGLDGYDGPYYRLRAGQNPGYNNGLAFDNVELHGVILGDYVFGDGILLLKEQTTIVSDIIIDNCNSGTSPSSEPAELGDSFWQSTDCESDAYTVSCRSWRETYNTAKANSGSGVAVFRPTIGIAGNYRLSEWHPALSNGASNVKYRFHNNGTTTDFTVDQTRNSGHWNTLGDYYFNKGDQAYVEILCEGANGDVAADAIKLAFLDGNNNNQQNGDITPPTKPQGVKVKNGE